MSANFIPKQFLSTEFKFSLVQRMAFFLLLFMFSRCAWLQINSQSPAINFCFRCFIARVKSTYVNGEKTDRLLENQCSCLSLERVV